MTILTPPDIWRHCQLSIARHTGSIRINKHIYTVDYASGYLVRADFIKHVHELGLHTVEKALKRYADANKTKKVLSRLSRIVKARKSPQNDRQLSFEL